jgi:hypothetical protein
MVPEYNAPGGFRAHKITEQAADRPGRGEPADQDLRALPKAAQRSIDAIFDSDAPGQAEMLEGHRAAFGDDHCEMEPLGNGKVVLRLYPGGARRFL